MATLDLICGLGLISQKSVHLNLVKAGSCVNICNDCYRGKRLYSRFTQIPCVIGQLPVSVP